MLNRLYGIILKEILVLWRDKAGLAVLFLMPVALIIIMVIIQDPTFHFLKDVRVSVLLIDDDQDLVGKFLQSNLKRMPQIDLEQKLQGKAVSLEVLKEQVASGKYKAGIYIPPQLTEKIKKTLQIADISAKNKDENSIAIFFDPAINPNMKLLIQSILREILTRMETRFLYEQIQNEMALFGPQISSIIQVPDSTVIQTGRIHINSVSLSRTHFKVLPNSVQHNVPGWSMFAMFFIVIPLAGGMIQERDEGSLKRLLAMPVRFMELLTGKMAVYLAVCLSQFFILLMTGKYLMPLLGFPALQMGNHPVSMLIVANVSALAAIGYGMAVGTYAGTQQQASSFGAISVIIAAAAGGIWVPVFMMPEFMQTLSKLSPLSWGLNAFHDVFLRDGNVVTVINDILRLLLFFLFTMSLAMIKFPFGRE